MAWFPNIKFLADSYRLQEAKEIEKDKLQELERDIDDIGSSIEFIEAKTRSIENSIQFLEAMITDNWNKIERLIDYLGLEEVESIAKQEIRLVPKKKAAKRRKKK